MGAGVVHGPLQRRLLVTAPGARPLCPELAGRGQRAVEVPVTEERAVVGGVAVRPGQCHLGLVREQHRMVEPPQVVADPRRQNGRTGHARDDQPYEASAHRGPWNRQRERHQEEGGQQQQLSPRQRGCRHRDADRDDPSERGALPVAVGEQDRDVDDEDHHRLGQDHGIEPPDVRVHGQQPGAQQPHPGSGDPMTGQPSGGHRGGTEQARGQHVPGDGADPDEREEREVDAVERRVQS